MDCLLGKELGFLGEEEEEAVAAGRHSKLRTVAEMRRKEEESIDLKEESEVEGEEEYEEGDSEDDLEPEMVSAGGRTAEEPDVDAEEREGLQNSQLMLLRWEMSQSQFEEMEEGQSQIAFEEDDYGTPPTNSSIVSSGLASGRSVSLRRRPSFLAPHGEAVQKEKLEVIKRQNSYSNSACSNVVFGEDSSHSAAAPIRRRMQPVSGAHAESLFTALCSAPSKTREERSKRLAANPVQPDPKRIRS